MSSGTAIAAALAATATVLPGAIHADVTVPVLGVTVSGVGAATLGVLAAGAWADPIARPGQLFTVITSAIVLACLVAGLLPAFGMDWAQAAHQGPLCGVLGAVLRLWLAPVVRRGSELIRTFNPRDLLPRVAAAPAVEAPPPVDDAAKPEPPSGA